MAAGRDVQGVPFSTPFSEPSMRAGVCGIHEGEDRVPVKNTAELQ